MVHVFAQGINGDASTEQRRHGIKESVNGVAGVIDVVAPTMRIFAGDLRDALGFVLGSQDASPRPTGRDRIMVNHVGYLILAAWPGPAGR
jgi:hypothetical protein